MVKRAFDKMMAGIEDAIAFAEGDATRGRVASGAGMKPSDFHIGMEFTMSGAGWRCTDVGTRTICAIKLDKEDASWYGGPPYTVMEHCLDENDLEAVALNRES